MAYTWGTTTLKVAKYSYEAPVAENGLTEITILPSAEGGAASVLQQGGRGRYKVSFDGFADHAGYSSLLADYYACTPRTFTDEDGFSMTAVIETISAKRKTDPYCY